jgi:hypothetical protein
MIVLGGRSASFEPPAATSERFASIQIGQRYWRYFGPMDSTRDFCPNCGRRLGQKVAQDQEFLNKKIAEVDRGEDGRGCHSIAAESNPARWKVRQFGLPTGTGGGFRYSYFDGNPLWQVTYEWHWTRSARRPRRR